MSFVPIVGWSVALPQMEAAVSSLLHKAVLYSKGQSLL